MSSWPDFRRPVLDLRGRLPSHLQDAGPVCPADFPPSLDGFFPGGEPVHGFLPAAAKNPILAGEHDFIDSLLHECLSVCWVRKKRPDGGACRNNEDAGSLQRGRRRKRSSCREQPYTPGSREGAAASSALRGGRGSALDHCRWAPCPRMEWKGPDSPVTPLEAPPWDRCERPSTPAPRRRGRLRSGSAP